MDLQVRCSRTAYPDHYVGLEITMKKAFILLITLLCILLALNSAHSEGPEQVTVSIVYDSYACEAGYETDWGFSCVISGAEKTILFDTGRSGETLLHNLKKTQTWTQMRRSKIQLTGSIRWAS